MESSCAGGLQMYLKNVTIKNFKAISDMTLEFQEGINLLIGDNGAGKTSVLDALSIGLGGYLAGITGVPSKNILSDQVRFEVVKMGEASSALKYQIPTEVECTLNVEENKDYHWVRRRKDEHPNSKTTVSDRAICEYAYALTNGMSETLPVLSYQSEARVWQQKRGDFGSVLKEKLNDRRQGYIGCLDYSLDIKGIKEWCLKMEMEAFRSATKIAEYEAFKKLTASAMQKMNDLPTCPEIYYSRQVEDMVYEENGQIMPISYLSAGYQSFLWMVMDIAYRAAILNPNVFESLGQIPGIVLIDELDMHLHPKWQWNVIKALKETFPKIQFIIATHSPIVISSCKHERLIRISDNHRVDYLADAYAYSVEDILRYRQGSNEKPEMVVNWIKEFDEAMNLDDLETANMIIEEMKEELGEEHSEVKNLVDELEFDSWIEENV